MPVTRFQNPANQPMIVPKESQFVETPFVPDKVFVPANLDFLNKTAEKLETKAEKNKLAQQLFLEKTKDVKYDPNRNPDVEYVKNTIVNYANKLNELAENANQNRGWANPEISLQVNKLANEFASDKKIKDILNNYAAYEKYQESFSKGDRSKYIKVLDPYWQNVNEYNAKNEISYAGLFTPEYRLDDRDKPIKELLSQAKIDEHGGYTAPKYDPTTGNLVWATYKGGSNADKINNFLAGALPYWLNHSGGQQILKEYAATYQQSNPNATPEEIKEFALNRMKLDLATIAQPFYHSTSEKDLKMHGVSESSGYGQKQLGKNIIAAANPATAIKLQNEDFVKDLDSKNNLNQFDSKHIVSNPHLFNLAKSHILNSVKSGKFGSYNEKTNEVTVGGATGFWGEGKPIKVFDLSNDEGIKKLIEWNDKSGMFSDDPNDMLNLELPNTVKNALILQYKVAKPLEFKIGSLDPKLNQMVSGYEKTLWDIAEKGGTITVGENVYQNIQDVQPEKWKDIRDKTFSYDATSGAFVMRGVNSNNEQVSVSMDASNISMTSHLFDYFNKLIEIGTDTTQEVAFKGRGALLYASNPDKYKFGSPGGIVKFDEGTRVQLMPNGTYTLTIQKPGKVGDIPNLTQEQLFKYLGAFVQ